MILSAAIMPSLSALACLQRYLGVALVGSLALFFLLSPSWGSFVQRLQRVAAFGGGNLGHGALLVGGIRGQGDFDHLNLLPFVVEQAEDRCGRQLGAHCVTEVLAGQHRFQGFTLQAYTSPDSAETRRAFVEKRDASF